MPVTLEKIDICTYRIPTGYRTGMRVPGIIFANEELIEKAIEDKAIEQVVNVAFLPGIVKASMAMPDIHWGYGFPIGGVAAMRLDNGVVSPGGVGYDISCGVRLLRTNLIAADHRQRIPEIMHELSRNIPKGLGTRGKIHLTVAEMEAVLAKGAGWAVKNGYGWNEDLGVIEQGGTYKTADPDLVSDHAKQRGLAQLGTIGSGNHFVELQEVKEIFDPVAADAFEVFIGQLVIMIHSGSRGLGHQVCGDYLKEMAGAAARMRIELPDRQLACAPYDSPEGKRYLKAMAAAANFGLANRQCIAHWVRESFEYLFTGSAEEMGMNLVYDVSHNVAQVETHDFEGRPAELCVHRKGATRAFGPGREEVSAKYRQVGQPVIIPGDMGRASYLLVGTEKAMAATFGSTCHGAGRLMSRKRAKQGMRGDELRRQLAAEGVTVEAGSIADLPEEAPYAYKNVSTVVDVCQQAGISKKVARMRPLGVLKG